MNLRVVDTGQISARRNVAMTAALVEMHGAGRIPDTLRFHRYPKSVLVGRHQLLSQAIDVGRCEAAGVEIARRMTGGGAVYMAPGALAWDIVIGRAAVGVRLDHVAARICEAVASGLSRLGFSARYRPQNDIEVGGHKICGSSGYVDGPTLAYQGTILIDTDLSEMNRFLRLPADSRRQMTTIGSLLDRSPEAGEIEAVMLAGLSQAFGFTPSHSSLADQERSLADKLHREEFGLDAFVEGDVTAVAADAVEAWPALAAQARVS